MHAPLTVILFVTFSCFMVAECRFGWPQLIGGKFRPLSSLELDLVKRMCGKSKESSESVINKAIYDAKNNYTAEQGQFPWMVRVKGGGVLCGGSLISRRHVLTAAHCFFLGIDRKGYDAYHCKSKWDHFLQPLSMKYRVMVGSIYSGQGQWYNVTAYAVNNFMQNPGKCDTVNDIAILQLDQDVPEKMLFNYDALPICLPTSHTAIDRDEEDLIIAGWGLVPGLMKKGGVDKLRYTKISLARCKPRELKVTSTTGQFCTTETYASACQGDSGGPIFQKRASSSERERYEAVGLISSGTLCAWLHQHYSANSPSSPIEKSKPTGHTSSGLNTDVRHHLSWIKKYTNIA